MAISKPPVKNYRIAYHYAILSEDCFMNIKPKTDSELLELWEQLFKNMDIETTGASQETFMLSLIYNELCQRGYKSKQGAWVKEEILQYE